MAGQLGVQNQLVRVAPNIRMGCEILRFYLRAEHINWSRALARYNGSAGRNSYPALVMQRWQQHLALLSRSDLRPPLLQDLKIRRRRGIGSSASSMSTPATRALFGPWCSH